MVGAFTIARIAMVLNIRTSLSQFMGQDKGASLALMMKLWSSDVLLFTDGPSHVSPSMQLRLQQHGIKVCSETIAKLEGTHDGLLQKIHLQSGTALKRCSLQRVADKAPIFRPHWDASAMKRAARNRPCH